LILRETIVCLFVELLLEPVLRRWVVAYGQLLELLALGRTLCGMAFRALGSTA
jgi:hypothetical protein